MQQIEQLIQHINHYLIIVIFKPFFWIPSYIDIILNQIRSVGLHHTITLSFLFFISDYMYVYVLLQFFTYFLDYMHCMHF